MRKDESKKVMEALKVLGLNLNVVDASDTFAAATTQLRGVTTEPLHATVHPEEKRKIIGDTFMRVAEEEIRRLKLDPKEMFVAQGTLRPGLHMSHSSLTLSQI
jgi:GMP synthase (glutamine-hydrolysing)